MSIFGTFTTGKEQNEAERKWNHMWDLWVAGEAASPYAQLMEYESEVNNGGHSQYFFNVANCGDLKAEVETILPVLPEPLRENLERGYDAFAAQNDICDDENDELFEECDQVFYANEQLLTRILEKYANSLTL